MKLITEEFQYDLAMTSRRPVDPAWIMLVVCEVSCFMQDSWEANLFGMIWPTVGLCWIFTRLCFEASREGSTFLEMLVTMSEASGIFTKVFWWPCDMYYVLFTEGAYSSFRHEFLGHIYHDGPKYSDWANLKEYTSHRDWYLNETNRLAQIADSRIRNESRDLEELPHTIQVNAQTAYACGATVVAVSSIPQTTKAQELGLEASGWVTAVSRPTYTPVISVPDIRLRTIAKVADLGVLSGMEVFADLDILQAVQSKPNWLKMLQLNIPVTSGGAIHAGRIPRACTYNLVDPFVLETTVYPRVPYGFFGYGIQYEHSNSDLHLVADVTGETSRNFTDGRQFRTVNSSLRLDHDFRHNLNFGLACSVESDTLVTSFDSRFRPVDKVTVITMAYGTIDGSQFGLNNTFITRPFGDLPNIDLHTMIDCKFTSTLGFETSIWYSAGIGIRTRDSRWSATLDYNGSFSGARTEGPVLRLTHRF